MCTVAITCKCGYIRVSRNNFCLNSTALRRKTSTNNFGEIRLNTLEMEEVSFVIIQ